jgi:hypothetical protein
MNTCIKKQNHARLFPPFMISLSIVVTIFVSFSLIFQQSYAEDYKLNIDIKNKDEVNKETDLSIKPDDDTLETTVKLNDNPEKIKEEISGEAEDKVKVCLEDDDFKECQTKNLPKDEDSTIKFKLEYEA